VPRHSTFIDPRYDRWIVQAKSADIVEVEWQFSTLDTLPVARWLEGAAVPGYTVEPGPTKQLADTYFDTTDWRMHRAGFTCRVRRKGVAAELTLKSMAEAVDAVRSRREITEQLPAEGAEHPALASGPCGQAIRSIAGRHPLRAIFNVSTERRIFELADTAGTIAEIAVDSTSIPSGGDVPVQLARVEVEVDANAVVRAQRFVDVMIAAAGLSPAGTSKFEAALIATGQHVAPAKPDFGSTELRPEQTAGEAAFAILRKQFAIFLMNEGSTRLGEDIEGLHDMRVAARRMRAALSAFGPHLSPRMEAYRNQLGWVAALLGDVRDLDVQLERMAGWREGFSDAEAHSLDNVEALFTTERDGARKRMLAGLDSRRYESLVARFGAVLRRGPARTFTPGREPALTVAPALVEKRYRRLRRQGDAIDRETAAPVYHALRIDAKKLRYALEFFGPLYGKPATDFAVRLTGLQDLLGLHQDADVAGAMLHEMAERNARKLGAATLLVMGAIGERYRRHAEELRHDFPKVYRPLSGPEWRRLRKLMEDRRPA
jgi:triphosphatase